MNETEHDDTIPQKGRMEAVLDSLEMVEWDRFVRGDTQEWGVYFDIYGWIDREGDSHKDFILLRLFPETDDNLRMFTTSSDRYHDEINTILFGDGGESNSCERVEHTFDVENAIELSTAPTADGGEIERPGELRELHDRFSSLEHAVEEGIQDLRLGREREDVAAGLQAALEGGGDE